MQKDLDIVKSIVLSELENYEAEVYLFGSHARGTSGRKSDIDVAIIPKEIIPSHVFSIIREKLEDSIIPYNVDLVDLSTVEDNFRERVIKEGIKWTEQLND